MDVLVGCFSVSILFKGVVDGLIGYVQGCMVRMLMVLGIVCGLNLIV